VKRGTCPPEHADDFGWFVCGQAGGGLENGDGGWGQLVNVHVTLFHADIAENG